MAASQNQFHEGKVTAPGQRQLGGERLVQERIGIVREGDHQPKASPARETGCCWVCVCVGGVKYLCSDHSSVISL